MPRIGMYESPPYRTPAMPRVPVVEHETITPADAQAAADRITRTANIREGRPLQGLSPQASTVHEYMVNNPDERPTIIDLAVKLHVHTYAISGIISEINDVLARQNASHRIALTRMKWYGMNREVFEIIPARR